MDTGIELFEKACSGILQDRLKAAQKAFRGYESETLNIKSLQRQLSYQLRVEKEVRAKASRVETFKSLTDKNAALKEELDLIHRQLRNAKTKLGESEQKLSKLQRLYETVIQHLNAIPVSLRRAT